MKWRSVFCVIVASATACQHPTAPTAPQPPAETAPQPTAGTTVVAPPPVTTAPDFATLAERVVPTVVSIQVEHRVRVGGPRGRGAPPFGGPGGPFEGGDPFDFFRYFGGGGEVPREFENRGLGSGFVIDPTGLILTNAHVVEKADSIEVTFSTPDGGEKRLPAKIVGQAIEYDVALIRTETDAKATTVPLGDSNAMRIGNWVMAIGNPFGLDHSVSVGIISAKQRRDIAPSGRQGLYDFLQTDASINPGNSGGPLINLQGEVIGINSAINAQGQGIGFAIPINMVKDMLPQLQKGGRFVRSWIGIKIQPLNAELAQSYGLQEPRGVLVAEVVKEGPGARAGLREGDIILEFDGKRLNRGSDLQLFASMAGVGKSVPLLVWRDKAEKKLDVKLEAFPDEEAAGGAEGEEQEQRAGLGLTLSDLTASVREQLGVTSPQGGVLVEGVEPGSPAARASLRRGDVIMDVNDEPVSRASVLAKKIKGLKSGDVLRLKVERQGTRSFTALRKP
ncbi:MAG TPA: Do family serine endopeptidase [Myxococcota bacterium]|nr:Do family serine endopeptidase [Myxococcota bacterium]